MKEVIVNAEDLVCLNKEKLQEIIRCKDCKHFAVQYDDSGYYMGNCKYMYIATPNSYCSYAKRKEE